MSRSSGILLAIVVVVGGLGAWWWKSRGSDEAPKYRSAPVERGDIEALVSATGTVTPVEQVEVGSQVSGTVQKLFADYNSRVRRGQVLCQLDPASFRARVAQSDAAVAKAQAALKEAKRQLARAQELIAKDYISKADVEAAELAVEQQEAELKQARAQLQASTVDLDNTTIRAPIDGVVIARSVDLGQTVAASLQAPKLFVIANDLSKMQVETRIDEADVGRIHLGLPVRFTVDAFPDATFPGSVAQVRLEPIVDQGVVTYTTVIHTDNPDQKLRPGMTANVSVMVDTRHDALKVPNAALRFRPPETGGRRGQGRPGATAASGSGGASGAMAANGAGGAGSAGAAGSFGGARAGRASSGGADTSRGGGRMGGRRGSWARGGRAGVAALDPSGPSLKPGTVYVLRDGKPVRVSVLTGITDGAFTEVRSDELKPSDLVVVGTELSARGANLQPPPGMGGPGFGGGGRGGGGGGGRR